MSQNLPATQKANTIRALLEKDTMRKQIAMAIPKHMSVDRLLRVAMTSIRTNPKLLNCTQESLLACIMGCATLGLEPEPFLGQAYLVPFGNQCTLIPGYRGYIALARRSGEVKSVTAQVVYENDRFEMEYGLEEILKHTPVDGDRGKPKGAYVIFRYKDGSHSFDYMSVADIEKIRERSKAKDSGPWVTDWAEMAKKTVIRRHIKLVPLSVEMATAAAAEEKAFAGESQASLFLDTQEGEFTEVDEAPEVDPAAVEEFFRLVNAELTGGPLEDPKTRAKVFDFVSEIAKVNKQTPEVVKAQAGTEANFPTFWQSFQTWHMKHDKKAATKPKAAPEAEKGTESQDKPEASPSGGTVGQGSDSAPTAGELLARIDTQMWPISRLEVKFGKKYDDWGPAELSQLADMAG